MGAGGPRRAGGGGPDGGPAAGGFEDVDFSQIFGDRCGGDAVVELSATSSRSFAGPRRPRQARGAEPQRGADLATEIEVPFTTAILGGEAQISVRRQSGEVETIVVKIPAGIEDGKKIRLRGQGEAPPAAAARPATS